MSQKRAQKAIILSNKSAIWLDKLTIWVALSAPTVNILGTTVNMSNRMVNFLDTEVKMVLFLKANVSYFTQFFQGAGCYVARIDREIGSLPAVLLAIQLDMLAVWWGKLAVWVVKLAVRLDLTDKMVN